MMIHYWLLKKTFATSFDPPVAAEAARYFLICVSLSHIRILTHSQLKCWDWRIKHIIADDFSHDGYLCHLPTIVNASQESNKAPSSRLHDLTVFYFSMAASEYRKISEEASDIDSPTLEAGETEELLVQATSHATYLSKLPSWAYAIASLCLVLLGFAAGLFIDLDLDRKCLLHHSYYCG